MECVNPAASGRFFVSGFGRHKKNFSFGGLTAWRRNWRHRAQYAASQDVASTNKVISYPRNEGTDDSMPLLGIFIGPELFDLQTRDKIFWVVGTSGFDYLHAYYLNFDEDGGIYFDSPEFMLAVEGQWVDSTGFSTALEDLKKPEIDKLGVDRVYMTIGGKDAEDFERVAALMDVEDDYENDVQRNLRAIYDCCPAIDGFNIDGRLFGEEKLPEYLQRALIKLCKICVDEGFYVSFTASGHSTWWTTCAQELIEYFSLGLTHVNIEISDAEDAHSAFKAVKRSIMEKGIGEIENAIYPFCAANQQAENLSLFGDRYGGVVVNVPHSQSLSSYSDVLQMVADSVSRKVDLALDINGDISLDKFQETERQIAELTSSTVEAEGNPTVLPTKAESDSKVEALRGDIPSPTSKDLETNERYSSETNDVRNGPGSSKSDSAELRDQRSAQEDALDETEGSSIQSQRLKEIKKKAERVLSEVSKQKENQGDKAEKVSQKEGLNDIKSKAEKVLSDLSQSQMISPEVRSASRVETPKNKNEYFFQDESCSQKVEDFVEELEKLRNSSETAESTDTETSNGNDIRAREEIEEANESAIDVESSGQESADDTEYEEDGEEIEDEDKYDYFKDQDINLPLSDVIAYGKLLRTELYGGDQNGEEFDDFLEDIVNINEIFVYYGEHVNGIKATYNLADGTQYDGPVHGRPEGEQYRLRLHPGEYLVNIETMAGWWIDRICLYTRSADNEIILHGPFGGIGGYKSARMENEPSPHAEVGDNDDLALPVVCLRGETLGVKGKKYLCKIGLYVKQPRSSKLESVM